MAESARPTFVPHGGGGGDAGESSNLNGTFRCDWAVSRTRHFVRHFLLKYVYFFLCCFATSEPNICWLYWDHDIQWLIILGDPVCRTGESISLIWLSPIYCCSALLMSTSYILRRIPHKVCITLSFTLLVVHVISARKFVASQKRNYMKTH